MRYRLYYYFHVRPPRADDLSTKDKTPGSVLGRTFGSQNPPPPLIWRDGGERYTHSIRFLPGLCLHSLNLIKREVIFCMEVPLSCCWCVLLLWELESMFVFYLFCQQPATLAQFSYSVYTLEGRRSRPCGAVVVGRLLIRKVVVFEGCWKLHVINLYQP